MIDPNPKLATQNKMVEKLVNKFNISKFTLPDPAAVQPANTMKNPSFLHSEEFIPENESPRFSEILKMTGNDIPTTFKTYEMGRCCSAGKNDVVYGGMKS